jgi:hypothetical protein
MPKKCSWCSKYAQNNVATMIQALCIMLQVVYEPHCNKCAKTRLGFACAKPSCKAYPRSGHEGYCFRHSPHRCAEHGCETTPQQGHEGYCIRHSPHSCAEHGCETTPQHGHEGYCYRHSKKPLVLPTDWILDNSLTDIHALKAFAEKQRGLGRKLYIGLAGVSKRSTILGEIDNDELRMKELFLMTRKLAHSFVILHPLGDQPGHNRARLGEAWLIRELGLNTLMNERNGGAGRPPFYDAIGAVFVLVGQ